MMGKDEFIKFSMAQNDDKCLELPEKTHRLNDEQLSELMYEVTKCKDAAEFQTLDVQSRDNYIRQLRDAGMSIREVSRMTGVSAGIVRRF